MFHSTPRPADEEKYPDEVEQGSEDLAGGNEDPNMVCFAAPRKRR